MKYKYLRLIARSNYSRIFVASMLVGLFVMAVFGLESFTNYKNELKNATIHSANLTHVLEEQISGVFRTIDISLQELQRTFMAEKNLSITQSSRYNQWLKTRRDRLPEVLSFKLIDQDGKFIGDDRGEIFNGNLADREYFQYLKKVKRNELIISKPVFSKTASVWVIVLTRPILGNDGQFKGLVLATIPLSHFKTMFSELNVGPRGVISIYSADHYVYARKPWVDKYFGSKVEVASALDNFFKTTEQVHTYRAISPLDQVERIVTARKLNGKPFVVLAGLAIDDVLFEWKVRTLIYTLFILVLYSAFAFFVLHFLHSLELVEEQRKQAIQSAKLTSLGEMASGIAHEINNPLTIISGLALTLKRSHSENEQDEKVNATIDRIVKTVDRIARIISGLRTFSRDSYNDPLVPTSVEKIINSTLDLCRERMASRNVDLRVLPFHDLNVLAREIQISQVIMNLLSNALDACEHSKEKWIKISVIDQGKMVVIKVSDSGPPINDAIAGKMMQPFFTTKSVGKGTGLGLSISRGIINSHKGNLYFDKKAPHTTFVIELPKA